MSIATTKATAENMPTHLVEGSHTPNKLSLSSFFEVAHNENGEAPTNAYYVMKTTGERKKLHKFLKDSIILENYTFWGKGRIRKGKEVTSGFRCRCCGYQRPLTQGTIRILATFERNVDAPQSVIVDGILIPLPETIELGNECMKDTKEVKSQLEKIFALEEIREKQVKWFKDKLEDAKYTYIGSYYHIHNLNAVEAVSQQAKKGQIQANDLMWLCSKNYHNMRFHNKPLRLYRGVGVSGVKNPALNSFLNGGRSRSMPEGVTYENDYIEVNFEYIETYFCISHKKTK